MKIQESVVYRNFTYLFINQFFNLIVPLLVFPFLLKTLGLELFGLYSFAYSATLFCFMFCDYGFNFSGSKYIAINKLDIQKRDTAFSAIVTLKGLIAIVISILWIVFVFYYPIFKNNLNFGLLFLGMILGNAINLQWFFQGIEKLGWYSTINSVIKLASNIAILVLVKSAADINLIPLIYSSAFILTGLITYVIAIYSEKISFISSSIITFKQFLKEGFDYFITISTTSLVFNGTIIILSFFEKSILIIGAFAALDRIIKILVSIYVPYSTAMYPRNMANFKIGYAEGRKSVIKYGTFALIFSIVTVVIICLFSDEIVFFLNPKLVIYSNWLKLFSFWFFFIVFNNLLGYHFLNGLNKSAIFRNINIVYTLITVALMVVGGYLFSFKGVIVSVLLGEVLLAIMLLIKTRQIVSNTKTN
jgi:PST family polysaccharide transporter